MTKLVVRNLPSVLYLQFEYGFCVLQVPVTEQAGQSLMSGLVEHCKFLKRLLLCPSAVYMLVLPPVCIHRCSLRVHRLRHWQ